MFDFIQTLLSFIVAIGILVAVHEWGHYYVARLCGVKVQRFSIGFGKALWSRYDKQGTEFVIAAIPLGGYVKMLDERVEQVKEEDLPFAFNRQNVWKRIAIIAAGPLTNFIFAIFALLLMFLIGKETVRPMVGEISTDSIASSAQLQSGMLINKVGGRDTIDWQAVQLELMSHIGKEKMLLDVTDSRGISRQFSLDISDWEFDPDKQSPLASLGIRPFRPKVHLELSEITENSAAQLGELMVGDKIVSIDGTSMQNWEQIVGYVSQHPNKKVEVNVLRNGLELQKAVTIGSRNINGEDRGFLGVRPKIDPWPEDLIFTHQYGPVDAFVKALEDTWRLITLSFEMLGKLITGDVSVKNLSGPISIAQGAGASAGYGLVYFLSFLALISVNLGIINLLPLPVLDGGHLLYYFIELLSGKPVPESVQEIGFRIGGAFLFLIMTIAIINDITRL